MSTHSNHPYHLVYYSPWPLTFHQFDPSLLILGTIITILTKEYLLQ